jgi:hypothetical protein
VLPSSPGAVQVRLTELDVALPVAKFVIAEGGVLSARGGVIPLATLDSADQLGTSSAVLIAK